MANQWHNCFVNTVEQNAICLYTGTRFGPGLYAGTSLRPCLFTGTSFRVITGLSPQLAEIRGIFEKVNARR